MWRLAGVCPVPPSGNLSSVETIRWFTTLRKEDVLIGGGKGANLGELTAAGVPVPPGFVVTSDAFNGFLRQSGLRDQILASLRNLDVIPPPWTAWPQTTARRAAAGCPGRRWRIHRLSGALAEVPAWRRAAFVGLRTVPLSQNERTFLNVRGADAVVEQCAGVGPLWSTGDLHRRSESRGRDEHRRRREMIARGGGRVLFTENTPPPATETCSSLSPPWPGDAV